MLFRPFLQKSPIVYVFFREIYVSIKLHKIDQYAKNTNIISNFNIILFYFLHDFPKTDSPEIMRPKPNKLDTELNILDRRYTPNHLPI